MPGQATAPDRLPGGRSRAPPTMPCERGRTSPSPSIRSRLEAPDVANGTGILASRVVSKLSFLITPTSCSCTRQGTAKGTTSQQEGLRDRRVVDPRRRRPGTQERRLFSGGRLQRMAGGDPDPRGGRLRGKRCLRRARRGSGSQGNRAAVADEAWAERDRFVRSLTSNRV